MYKEIVTFELEGEQAMDYRVIADFLMDLGVDNEEFISDVFGVGLREYKKALVKMVDSYGTEENTDI